jgi:hypothetical protein
MNIALHYLAAQGVLWWLASIAVTPGLIFCDFGWPDDWPLVCDT